MSSRFVKLTCAAALALPLAAFAVPSAHAFSWTPEEECTGLNGAATQHPHGIGGDSCYGVDQTPNHNGPSGDVYRGTTAIVQDSSATVSCGHGDYFYGIFYSLPDNHEAFRSLHDLESVSGVTITFDNGIPNGATGDAGSDGTSVTAACRDIA
jgi:hypothetical protein